MGAIPRPPSNSFITSPPFAQNYSCKLIKKSRFFIRPYISDFKIIFVFFTMYHALVYKSFTYNHNCDQSLVGVSRKGFREGDGRRGCCGQVSEDLSRVYLVVYILENKNFQVITTQSKHNKARITR